MIQTQLEMRGSAAIDKHTLPRGCHYHDAGLESRQVIDIEQTTMVTEYRAQILEDEHGARYVAH